MFRYLNLDNGWPTFKWEGLVNMGGALQLQTKPMEPEMGSTLLPGIPLNAAGLSGPARVGMDAEGNVYIPDTAGNRILVWRACDGAVCPVRCLEGGGSLPGQLNAPRGVLVGPCGVLYVADSGNHRIQLIDLATFQLRGIWGQVDPLGEPVASNEIGRLNDPWDLSEIRDHRGSVGGLILDRKGRLSIRPTVQPGTASLLPGQRYEGSGYFVGGTFAVSDVPTHWWRVRAVIDDLPPNSHIQFFTYTSVDGVSPSGPPAASPVGAEPVGPGVWRAAPMDATDFLILHEPAPFLWIAGILQGDGVGSPVVRQLGVEFDHEGWLRYLPAIYSRDESPAAFLERALALFEGLLSNVESTVDDLPMLFDPWAAKDQVPDSWLDWLSTWLTFELEELWAPTKRRQAVANAFEILGQRGTVQGLRQFIELYADIDVVIEEPARSASVWSLGENSTLGFTTMLAAAEAQGAVLGTTATVNRSHLIKEAEYGMPLFEDLAHRFCVLVQAAQRIDIDTMETLRRIIDREKPAHTSYHISVIEPRMQAGVGLLSFPT